MEALNINHFMEKANLSLLIYVFCVDIEVFDLVGEGANGLHQDFCSIAQKPFNQYSSNSVTLIIVIIFL